MVEARNDVGLRTGDWVVVRDPAEILSTLDADGALDGLPFMPEMVEYCGRRLQVLRKAEKTCVELPGGYYQMREFFQNDVFLLDELRCSGADHDGCQRLCMFHWKAAWLIPSPNAADRERPSQTGLTALRSALKTKSAPNRYLCQSTQIALATRPEPLKRVQILQKCFRDVRSGAVSVPKMIGLIIVPLYRKIRDRIVGRPRLVGTLKRTPVGTLALQPGEVVEIKSLEEMRQTLDERGRNRGLVCDIELKQFCGTRDVVRGRLEKMISEPTGEMKTVEGTVILHGNTCMCARVVGGCPRLEYCYWRELWLKRVNSVDEPAPQVEQVCR